MSQDDLNNLSAEELAELQKKNCIFCKIIHKEIPSTEIYSDDKVMVILDINPAAEGHSIILPKQHYQILPQMPDDLIGYMSGMAKKTSRTLLRALGVKGTTVFVANGAIAGQKAPHFMIHVIPRKADDMLFELKKSPMDEKQLDEIKMRLAARMGALTGKKLQLTHKQKQEEKKDTKEDVKPEHKDNHELESGPAKSKKSEDMDLDKIADLFG